MDTYQQLPNETQPRGLTSDFMQLFLSLSSLNNGDQIGHTCNQCDQYMIYDYTANDSAIETIRQVMKRFYTTQLQYSYIPWTICEQCYSHFCPACCFDIITESIAGGVLTTTCPKCSEEYSYHDVMNCQIRGESVIIIQQESEIELFISDADSDQSDEEELTYDQYEQFVTSKPNDLNYECPICLNSSQSRVDTLIKCKHQFCRSCLLQSLKMKRQCPMCRASIVLE